MFQRILVPLDGSEQAQRALPMVARLARASRGRVILLRVVTPQMDFLPSAGVVQPVQTPSRMRIQFICNRFPVCENSMN